MLAKLFGYLLAAGIAATSLAMMIMGGRFQRVEAAAYAGERRPWWFYAVGLPLIGLYVVSLIDFLRARRRNWASWVLILLIPLGWTVKGALVVFNPEGRQTVSSIEGNAAWRKVGLARLPLAVVLAFLAYFAQFQKNGQNLKTE
jgi:H+/Cl- antiporter ClcA